MALELTKEQEEEVIRRMKQQLKEQHGHVLTCPNCHSEIILFIGVLKNG